MFYITAQNRASGLAALGQWFILFTQEILPNDWLQSIVAHLTVKQELEWLLLE